MLVPHFIVGALATLPMVVEGERRPWAAYVHIDASNWDTQDPPLGYDRPSFNATTGAVEWAFPSQPRGAWLVKSEYPLTPKSLHLRDYVWCDPPIVRVADYCDQVPAFPKSVLVTPLSDEESDLLVDLSISSEGGMTSVSIPLHTDEYRYLYVDYPSMVFDGGYYFSVDLKSFSNEKSNNTTRRKASK